MKWILTWLLSAICMPRSSIVFADGDWNYTDQDAWKHVPGWNCDGIRQSPVDINLTSLLVNNELIDPILLNFDQSFNGTFTNNGHSVRFDPSPDSPEAFFQNHLGIYKLVQFHFHWGPTNAEGSEHTIDGGDESGELHFVCKKETGASTDGDAYAVLGVFLIGHMLIPLKGSWEELFYNMPIRNHDINPVQGVRLNEFLPRSFTLNRYYHYEGSLTTPPCSEVVQWFMLRSPVYVPKTFMNKLRNVEGSTGQALTMNYRYTQPLKGRRVMITKYYNDPYPNPSFTKPADKSSLYHKTNNL